MFLSVSSVHVTSLIECVPWQ